MQLLYSIGLLLLVDGSSASCDYIPKLVNPRRFFINSFTETYKDLSCQFGKAAVEKTNFIEVDYGNLLRYFSTH